MSSNQFLTLGVASLNQTPFDWEKNKKNILSVFAEAQKQKVSILCLPELCITSYGCEDVFNANWLLNTAHEVLCEIAPWSKGLVVNLGLPVRYEGKTYNANVLLVDGVIVGFVCKKFLAGEGIHYEPRWFMPWAKGHSDSIEIGGAEVPIGDIYFDFGAIKLGFEICEDAWVKDRPGCELQREGVNVILNPSASHFAFHKLEERRMVVCEGSRAFKCAYLYSNLIGNEAGRAIYDAGSMIALNGEIIAQEPRLHYASYSITTAVISIKKLAVEVQTQSDSLNEKEKAKRVSVAFTFPFGESSKPNSSLPRTNWENSNYLKEEEFTRAVALGLFDYLRKSGVQGFVISLSGGADSTAVASLVGMMVSLAWKELGGKIFKERLSYIDSIQGCNSPIEVMEKLLTTVYQASAFSSKTTRTAARKVSGALGAHYIELEVESMIQDYIVLVQDALKQSISWKTHDVVLQNIQARVRGPSVWMIANIKNALLLSTSNRSEAAVGYATMDGDTCGGLSPIGGIDKAFLRRWLKWVEKIGPDGLGPIPELSYVNSQEPTAELRPENKKQTDEKDLMPYEVLDKIERFAVRDKKSPKEICVLLESVFPDYSLKQLKDWTDKFFSLWCKNQWKRERYAPSFHLDEESLDPKTWCRFPILSGGFK